MNRNPILPSLLLAAVLLTGIGTPDATASVVSVALIDDDGVPSILPAILVGAPVDGGNPAGNWNNVAVATPISSRTVGLWGNGTAVSTSFTFSLSGDGNVYSDGDPDAADMIRRNLVRAQATASLGDKDFTLSNTAALFGEGAVFSLYIYSGLSAGINTESEIGNLTVTLDTEAAKTGTTNFNGTRNVGNNPVNILGQDYMVISELTATSGDLQFDVSGSTNASGQGVGIGGFQLLLVPEPGTGSLVVCALMMVAAMRRRSRVGNLV